MHVHTLYSADSTTPLEAIIDRCNETSINCLAICDHGSIQGALALQTMAPFKVVIGEEILTPYGDILGLFMSQELPGKMTLEDAIFNIHQQNAIVCVPHPFDFFRNSSFCNRSKLLYHISDIDMIEVFNARSRTPYAEKKAKKLLLQYSKLASAGSDAHTASEIGSTYIEMPDFETKEEFLLSVSAGTIVGHKSNPFVHLVSTKNKFSH